VPFSYLLIADIGGLVSNMGQNTLLTNGRDDELESDNLSF
jgi:hypothetical protein